MHSSQKPTAVILVVEDEPLQRMMAVDIVEECGFEAVEAADANEAESKLDLFSLSVTPE